MNKRLKQFFLILSVCICLSMTNMNAYAATEYVDGYLRYTVEEGSVTITGYNGRESEVTIPAKIAGVPVNTIASGAFFDSSKVTKINLPDTIMAIEEGAFRSGQTVVYNSNTNDTVVTESEQSTQDTNSSTQDTNSSTEDTSSSTPNKEEDGKNLSQENTVNPSDEEESVGGDKIEGTTLESEKEGSIEEVDVDFSDDSKQETSKDENVDKETTKEEVSKDEVSKDENSKKEDFENLEDDMTTITTGVSREQTEIEPAFIVIVVLAIAGIGIYVYRKKGSK